VGDNVGKSTLFNALAAEGAAESANFPFCTIEPNVGMVAVPDERLKALAKVCESVKVVPTTLEFIDIAGLVKGASEGEGLGNKFLSHIRQVNAIAHVVRCFDDDNVVHVDGDVDPVRDVEVIDTELILSDIATLEKRLDKSRKVARSGNAEARFEVTLLERILEVLQAGGPVRKIDLDEAEALIVHELHFLTAKPVIFVANVAESDIAAPQDNPHVQALSEFTKAQGAELVTISASIESEVAQLDAEERVGYLAELGLECSGLDLVIKAGYRLLNLLTFLTAGPEESRAWTVRRGATAPQAAGVIHTDFERGFIKAEVMHWQDLVEQGSEAAVRSSGQLRIEGKQYVVQDGDVIHFRFNV